MDRYNPELIEQCTNCGGGTEDHCASCEACWEIAYFEGKTYKNLIPLCERCGNEQGLSRV